MTLIHPCSATDTSMRIVALSFSTRCPISGVALQSSSSSGPSPWPSGVATTPITSLPSPCTFKRRLREPIAELCLSFRLWRMLDSSLCKSVTIWSSRQCATTQTLVHSNSSAVATTRKTISWVTTEVPPCVITTTEGTDQDDSSTWSPKERQRMTVASSAPKKFPRWADITYLHFGFALFKTAHRYLLSPYIN